MRIGTGFQGFILVLGLCASSLCGEGQTSQGPAALVATDSPIIIPPTVSKISPAGMERGTTAVFTIEGRNLSDATEVLFDAAGMSGKVTGITDVPEKISGPRAGEDLGAQVPLGKKQSATLELTVAADAWPGLHRFRVKTPLGTTNSMVIAVGELPEVKAQPAMAQENTAQPQHVNLPATMIGSIEKSGGTDSFEFEGKAGEDVVFQVQASQLGSNLRSLLVLSDSAGKVLATAGKNDNHPDAVLQCKLPEDGKYTVAISDRNRDGGMGFFYRLNGGPLPYITSVFPLGVRAGTAAEVTVTGLNLGSGTLKIDAPAAADGWTTMPVDFTGSGKRLLKEVRLAVGNEPDVLEQEPNNSVAQAQRVLIPVAINGHIDGGSKATGMADEDYFRFHAAKGERLDIDVAAARLGSGLDSVIEVLDAAGNAIPRATIRCLNQTTAALSDKDAMTQGIRLTSTSGLREGDYLMVGDELNQIDFIPDQPDADSTLKGMGGLRLAYLGTSPDVHPVNTPVYKAQILPPDSDAPSNGLPVYHLTWRNDDGGPGYGADSRLDFVAPAEGDYILHLKDVRGMEGADFAYRLTLRDARPDYRLSAGPSNPNIPRGGSAIMTVSVTALRGFDGAIDIEVKGLPAGVSAAPATIPAGQLSTEVVLTATANASLDTHPAPIQIVGHAMVDGRDLTRIANKSNEKDPPLQLASIVPAPDVVVSTEANQVSIEPGKEVTVTLKVDRHNGFKGRVPCFIRNLPPGVRVVNVGLNGVLVTSAQSSRTFTLRAEEWAKPISQPIYVVGTVESNSSTDHPSAPLLLKVEGNVQTARAIGGAAGANK